MEDESNLNYCYLYVQVYCKFDFVHEYIHVPCKHIHDFNRIRIYNHLVSVHHSRYNSQGYSTGQTAITYIPTSLYLVDVLSISVASGHLE